MKSARYFWRLFCESFHRRVVVILEIIELGGIIVIHPLEKLSSEFKSTFESLNVFFIAALVSTFILGLLIAGYQLYLEEEMSRKKAEDKVKPQLAFCRATKYAEGRWRVKVVNESGKSLRFSAEVASSDQDMGYRIPSLLQLTGTEPPHREVDIAGYGEKWVDVIEAYGVHIGLLSAEHPASTIPLPRKRYRIGIRVFPVPQHDGGSKTHHFYIIPQKDDGAILGDAD